jgi:hypothetical protein
MVAYLKLSSWLFEEPGCGLQKGWARPGLDDGRWRLRLKAGALRPTLSRGWTVTGAVPLLPMDMRASRLLLHTNLPVTRCARRVWCLRSLRLTSCSFRSEAHVADRTRRMFNAFESSARLNHARRWI